MAGVYAPDGSYNVTIVADGVNVSVTNGSGLYAPDGSLRVTPVNGAFIVDQTEIEVDLDGTPTTVTITVTDGVITAIDTE